MKGTLFSGDFIKDELGNLRLVEFNTDTAAGRTTSAELDFSGLYQILNDKKSANYDFSGYIEGNHLMDGDINVIVSDGFTGNVALKTAEGTANFITGELKKVA